MKRRTILNYWIVVHLVTALNGYPINESIAESEADYSEFAHDANSTTTVSPHDEALAALCRSKNSTFPGSRFGITDCLPCARICDSNDHYDQISCAAVRADGFCLPTTANSTTSRKPTENTSATETSTVISGHRFHPIWLVISMLVAIVAVVIAVTKVSTGENPMDAILKIFHLVVKFFKRMNQDESGQQFGTDEAPAAAPPGTNGGEKIAQSATADNEEYPLLYEGMSDEDGNNQKKINLRLKARQVAMNNNKAVSLVQQSNDQQSTRPFCYDSPEGSTA